MSASSAARTTPSNAGSPDQSAVLFRMNSRGGFNQMPPFATKVVDPESVALVSDWIRGLPPR